MEKLLNFLGLTTLKSAELRIESATKKAVENALKEKRYASTLRFARNCRKYNFKVVAVDVEDVEAMANSRRMAEIEFNADMAEQNEFERLFIPNVKPSKNRDLLK